MVGDNGCSYNASHVTVGEENVPIHDCGLVLVVTEKAKTKLALKVAFFYAKNMSQIF